MTTQQPALTLSLSLLIVSQGCSGDFDSKISGSEQNTFSVGGVVTGLSGTLVLELNEEQSLSLTENGSFVFESDLSVGESYEVIVATQPLDQECTLVGGMGQIESQAVTSIDVTCSDLETDATLSVAGSPLTLTANGAAGILTITNTSASITALNITSNFTGTALDGNVAETGNTCASLAPLASCVLTFTPDATVGPQTNFTVSGINTASLSVAISVQSGSTLTAISPTSGSALGGVGFTITGTGLTGATEVTFGGVAATSINVVNSTTVTGVSPANAAGLVDIGISTPAGGATLTDGYTVLTAAVGQAIEGGVLACLGSGFLDFIAAPVDNSTSITFGGRGSETSASSTEDGLSNTTLIVNVLGNNGGVPYAAKLCSDYEVDSQGNTPCQAGNLCFADWFLPSEDQSGCLYTNRVAIGGFSTDFYMTSTEVPGFEDIAHIVRGFASGAALGGLKDEALRLRCIRAL
jgi:hypothetical protein